MLEAGERHRRDATDHTAAAELLAGLRALQTTAEGRAACWVDLCAEQSTLLPRLLHGALHWFSQATLPALKLISAALSAKPSAKPHGEGCVGSATPYVPLFLAKRVCKELYEAAIGVQKHDLGEKILFRHHPLFTKCGVLNNEIWKEPGIEPHHQDTEAIYIWLSCRLVCLAC